MCDIPFNDHNAPAFDLIMMFCRDAHKFLSAHPDNVIAVVSSQHSRVVQYSSVQCMHRCSIDRTIVDVSLLTRVCSVRLSLS